MWSARGDLGSQRGFGQSLFLSSFRILMLASGLAKQNGGANITHTAPPKTGKHEPWLQPFSTVLFLSLRPARLKGAPRPPASPSVVVIITIITRHLPTQTLISSTQQQQPTPPHSPHIRTTNINKMLAPIFLAALAGTAAALPAPQVKGDGITYGNWTVRADWSRRCTLSSDTATQLLIKWS